MEANLRTAERDPSASLEDLILLEIGKLGIESQATVAGHLDIVLLTGVMISTNN